MTFESLFETIGTGSGLAYVLGALVGLISYGVYAFGNATSRFGKQPIVQGVLGFFHCAFILLGTALVIIASHPPLLPVVLIWMFLGWAMTGIMLGQGFPRRLGPAIFEFVSPFFYVILVTVIEAAVAGQLGGIGLSESMLVESSLLLGLLYTTAVVATMVNQLRVYAIPQAKARGQDLKSAYTIGAVMVVPLCVFVIYAWVSLVPEIFQQQDLARIVAWVALVVAAVEVSRRAMKEIPDTA